jgi:hypothetical protein
MKCVRKEVDFVSSTLRWNMLLGSPVVVHDVSTDHIYRCRQTDRWGNVLFRNVCRFV